MIAVFVALKMPLSIRAQRLFLLKFNANQDQRQYLALKFLYFKFKLLIYDPKLLKTSKQLPNATKALFITH